ncbi:hypothetical protein M153_4127000161, partial [Pseudoloma neurophilia]
MFHFLILFLILKQKISVTINFKNYLWLVVFFWSNIMINDTKGVLYGYSEQSDTL